MLILRLLPGEPEPAVIWTPATCPWIACSIRWGFRSSIVFESTTATEPVTSLIFWDPYPITTTCSNASASLSKYIFRLFKEVSFWVCVIKPR